MINGFGNFFYSSKIQNTKFQIRSYNEISRMRVCVQGFERMCLIGIEIPEGLPHSVPHVLSQIKFHKIGKKRAFNPIHRDNAFARQFGIIRREHNVFQMFTTFRHRHRTLQFAFVISFFHQHFFHFAGVMVEFGFGNIHNAQCQRLYHFNVGL